MKYLQHTINTRRGPVRFSRPGSGYVYGDMDARHPGTLGSQLCRGGCLRGDTLVFDGDDAGEFAALCRAWWRAYLRNLRS